MPQLAIANYPLTRLKYCAGLDAAGNVRHSYAFRHHNVMDYGATGDGVTNDTAAIASAVAALPAGGGALYFPAGAYLVDSGTIIFGAKPVALYGDGQNVSTIVKRTNGTLIDSSGTQSSTRNFGSSISDVELDGNSLTGAIVKLWHVSLFHIDDCYIHNNIDVTFDLVECWDSRFTNLHMLNCGGVTDATKPVVLCRNTANNSGAGVLGYSTDNCNQLVFSGCHWETFKDGAIWTQQGHVANTSQANGIRLINCKIETIYVRGAFVKVNNYTRTFEMITCYFYAGGKDAGVAANSVSMIEWFGPTDNQILDCAIINSTDAFQNIIECWANPRNDMEFYFEGTIPGNGAVVNFTGGSHAIPIKIAVASNNAALPASTNHTTIEAMADADKTLYGYTFEHIHSMSPSVLRTVTLAGSPFSGSNTSEKMLAGDRKRIINNTGSANSITVKNLTAGGTTLKTVTAGTWSDFEFDNTNWVLIGSGTL